MTTFAKATALFQQRPARAASLSLLPGLGQLYNRRLDKAFAFFIVDVANLAFLSVLLGGKLLFNLNSEHWQSNLASWSYGTAPFFVIQTLLLTYIGYSVFDAYKDALLSEESGKKPELCLSHTTCASYILHLSALCAIFFVILFKITPHEMKPEQPQISLTFDLQSPTGEKRQTGQMTQNLPESFSAARIKDLPKENELNASSQSAELTAGQNKVLSLKDASQETQAISSK